MQRETEIELIDELLALKAAKSAYLDESVTHNPVEYYVSEERFARERASIFRRLPTALAHVSELAGAGAFLRRELAGLPVLLTRDKEGNVHAFLNVCRHRGTRLVNDDSGCQHRFSCPYHAWTYSSSGELVGAPHYEQGFGSIDQAKLSLVRLPAEVRFGLVWVSPDRDANLDMRAFFGALSTDLDALEMNEMVIAGEDVMERAMNWKIVVEGGIEAYHFRVAHRDTIGPHFEANLSSYRCFGPHMRSILPRTTLAKLSQKSRESWRLRDHANVLYTLFPSSQLLVMQDHIVWISQDPQAAGKTRLRLCTLVPPSEVDDTAHWTRNHKITMMTLNEDFEIGESIQASIDCGANTDMLFGRFEGALNAFNRTVDSYLE
jgi:phenylpropionate dioxygenase-like ring-hydroxylating dioxygenase large terminal subunit